MPNPYTNLFAAAIAALTIGNAAAEDQHERHVHQDFAKDVDALHSVLAPLWHAQPGKERSQEVCAKANQLEGLAKDIRSGDNKEILSAIAALAKQCQKSPADIDAAFADVHEAFHRLAEARGR